MVTLLGQPDLSAAFDCADHSKLLDRLWSAVGPSDSVLDWVRSFLTDRSQQIAYTVVNYLLYSRCCLGFRKDPYWARCCTFSTQLS